MPTVVMDKPAKIRFFSDVTEDLLEARASVASLAESCRIAAKSTNAPNQLSRAACYIYELLIVTPGIFEEPKPVSNAELRKHPILAVGRIAITDALTQLEQHGLIARQGSGDDQKIKLLAPQSVISAHDARRMQLWELNGRTGNPMPFIRSLAWWTTFLKGCNGPVH